MSFKDKVLQLLLTSCSYFVPKNKKLVLFGAGDSKQFQGNPKYLLLYLNTINSELEYYWSAKSKKQQTLLNSKKIPFINPYSLKGFTKLLRAKYLFIEKSSYDVYYTKIILGRFNFIQTWHAIPFKKVGIHAKEHQSKKIQYKFLDNVIVSKVFRYLKIFSRHKYKKIISSSDVVSKIFSDAFENENMLLSGYPRNDIFFNEKLIFNEPHPIFKKKIKSKFILYAPTFRDHKDAVNPFSEKLIKFNETLISKNYFLLIKKHPWEKKLIIPKGLSNIIDLSNEIDDIQELMPNVDAIITDYSSTFFDFMVSGKPVLFFPYDFEEYTIACRGIYFDYFKELQGPFAINEEELFQQIIYFEELQHDDNYLKKYRWVLNKYNCISDGSSSKKLMEHLYPNISF